jgi:hypothetical protein
MGRTIVRPIIFFRKQKSFAEKSTANGLEL